MRAASQGGGSIFPEGGTDVKPGGVDFERLLARCARGAPRFLRAVRRTERRDTPVPAVQSEPARDAACALLALRAASAERLGLRRVHEPRTLLRRGLRGVSLRIPGRRTG